MAPEPKKPDITRITGRYIDAWEMFGTDIFSSDELETELLRNRDPEEVPDSDKIDQDLYRVSGLGLVDWFGKGKYRVAISPDAGRKEWDGLIEQQTQWIHSETNKLLEEREEEVDSLEESDSPEIIEYNGLKFMSAFVGPSSDLEGQARYYQAALSPDSHDGVVLRSYQGVANSTTELAEQVCDEDLISETDCVYRFEVAGEEMAKVDDDLEFRVYLKETRLL